MEKFLLEAKVEDNRETGVGVTNSLRATMFDGALRHDGHIQTIDERKLQFQSVQGNELNFRDAWQFNVAGYRLDRLLGLNMTPVSVERKWRGRAGSYTWWVDNVTMDERQRLQRKIEPPDADRWNRQISVLRVFDQLIYNTDRNTQNMVIDADWNLWMIDHTRAFRLQKQLLSAKQITRCDRRLLATLRELNRDAVKDAISPYLTSLEIDGLMARRDAIVKLVDQKVTQEGEAKILYDRPQRL
jgi:hypothetical protein